VRHLSTGQRRRVSLGALRLQPATLWILDEPLAGLDKSGIDLICGWIGKHLQEGGIAVIATHRPQAFSGSYQVTIEL
jgi:heme exporter protein A